MAVLDGEQAAPAVGSEIAPLVETIFGEVARVAYSDGFDDGVAAAPGPDTTPPTITIVSPTPDTAPGADGGFPRHYYDAKDTAIVIDIADSNPGVELQLVVARLYADVSDANPTEEVAYRQANFRGRTSAGRTRRTSRTASACTSAVAADGRRTRTAPTGTW